MNVLLLAAGRGERLKPFTDKTPKCLIPIIGIPLLKIWLEKFVHNEMISKIYINTHYLSELVRDFVEKDYKHVRKIELLHETELLGNGGTLVSLLPKLLQEDLLVAHADNLSLFSFGLFYESFENRPDCCDITMMTFFCDNPSHCGIVTVDDNKVVQSFHEKPAISDSNLANGAVYFFSKTVLSSIKEKEFKNIQEISLDVTPKFIGRINAWHNTGYHRDIGTPVSYQQALRDIDSQLLKNHMEMNTK